MNDFFDLNCFQLKRECSEEASEKHVRTWLEYKIDVLKDNEGTKVKDPDACDEARKFYQKIWKNLLEESGLSLRPKAKRFSKNPDHYVQGDWMCSVTTTFRKGLILFVNENGELRNFFPKRVKDGVGGYNTYAPILLKDMEKEPDKQNFREFWGDEVLQNFIRSAYTFANLIIVPDGFNSARLKHTEDYWDRTLGYYFEYFNPEDPRIYKNCDVGTPFHTLVEKSREHGDRLFLNEWLDQENKPKMLPDKNPTSIEEWRELMREMTRRIDRRRELMAQYIDRLQNE
ncbi:MAG: hypothetical protein E7D71_09320 [Varibaculum cambriense]|nr:hypothetical protein [Varibaculum cambriense]